ncbi:MAG: hypothetical protein MRY78_14605 [Saprospiraceae bacterium]|nr:hypothetical protein [Saprospiraceae bacterium]
MEQAENILEEYGPKVEAFIASLSWVEWSIAGGSLFLLILIPVIVKQTRKRKALRMAPKLAIEGFQISPLGKDAFLKIKNSGDKAVLSKLDIKGRSDIEVTSAVAGHTLEKDNDYGVLLHINTNGSIKRNFTIELTYLNQNGTVYKQRFPLAYDAPSKPKIVRYK